ncbi:MAG: hypothetical protein QMD96_00050 [Anaerosomatales bacterium]|nr:hypothetical protein [Anaerosomatales bacterium]
MPKPDEKLVRPHWFWLHEAGEASTLTMPAEEFFAEFEKAQRGTALLRFAHDTPLSSVGLDPSEDDDGWRPPLEPLGPKNLKLTRRASEKRTRESTTPYNPLDKGYALLYEFAAIGDPDRCGYARIAGGILKPTSPCAVCTFYPGDASAHTDRPPCFKPLEERVGRESLLKRIASYATNYGFLSLGSHALMPMRHGYGTVYAEDLRDWVRAIERVRAYLKLHAMLMSDDALASLEAMWTAGWQWASQRRFCITVEGQQLPLIDQAREIGLDVVDKMDDDPREGIKEALLDAMERLLSDGIFGHVIIRLTAPAEMHGGEPRAVPAGKLLRQSAAEPEAPNRRLRGLEIVASDLLGTIWAFAAALIMTDVRMKRCEYCGVPFVQLHGNKKYCNDSHKTQAFRERSRR